MTGRRLAAAAGWATVAAGAASVLATVAGRRARFLGLAAVIAQSVVPWSALAAWPVVAMTARGGGRKNPMATAGTIIGTAGIAIAARTAGRPAGAPRARPDHAQSMTIAHINLLYRNHAVGRSVATLHDLDADVLVFGEYTPAHAEVLASHLADRYPHRLEHAHPAAHGIALWSRFPVEELPANALAHRRITADVTMPGGLAVRVLAVHPFSPPSSVARWRAELAVLASEPPPADRPAVMVGDFNASWNHPELRSIAATGWRSAHRDRGRGLSTSWPVHRIVPPFVRIDHALVNDRLTVVRVADFTLPGSDHRGLVVTVARAQ